MIGFQEEREDLHAKQLPYRYDGVAKVTGKAKYAAEFNHPDTAYAYIVQSTIPNGALTAIDQTAASKASGVLAILTPFNAPKLPQPKPQPPARRHITVLQEKDIWYNGQPIAVVVARSLPEARFAAGMLKVTYSKQPAKLDFTGRLSEGRPPKQQGREPADTTRGDITSALGKAPTKIDVVYTTPIQNHNPMEPHATTATWDGDKLNVYDATQYITGDKMSIARTLGIPMDNVRVQCPYTGGGFGSKGSTWSHVVLAAMAAKVVGKPVKLVLDRNQMFGPVGTRPTTHQHLQLGATPEGKLLAIQHDVTLHTSVMEDFLEPSAYQSRYLYDSDTNATSHRLVDMNLGVCTFQRAPGEATGTVGIECAMDELAHKLKIDPLQLRLSNYAQKDVEKDKPWTSKHLKEAYSQAADRFGWSKRSAEPGQTREGNLLIGHGMATAIYGANRSEAQAMVRILPNGRGWVGSGTQDLGTGMYTIMAQTCADALGLDPTEIDVKLGDSTLPKAPVSGGSQSAASVCPAIPAAALQAMLKLSEMAVGDAGSPLHGLATADLDFKAGRLFSKADPAKGETYAAILTRNGNKPVEGQGSAEPSQDHEAFTAQSWGAVFAEVAVDADTHMVQVRRIVATYDIGTLMNNKTGINQLQGGIVWGVSTALHEESHIDPVYGRTANENFAEYHVPVNADIGTVDVTCLNIPDTRFNPLGARGIGEIGITGAAAAVANAIFNATGKRIREFPITPDKIMQTKSETAVA
jgi:xanthine dehydrogenase YagR molybdenum-binding subunit